MFVTPFRIVHAVVHPTLYTSSCRIISPSTHKLTTAIAFINANYQFLYRLKSLFVECNLVLMKISFWVRDMCEDDGGVLGV